MSRTSLPAEGRDPEALLAEMSGFRDQDPRYREGRTFSMVYWVDPRHESLLERAGAMFHAENGLHPLGFRSLRRMEQEVVQMTAGMLHGPATTVGCMTSGGTESLLLAVLTWRDRARRTKPWILRPNVVVPASAHPAFDKAAHLMGVAVRRARVGEDGRVEVDHVARLVNRQTVLVVGSAPQYPHGTVDPIPELGVVAREACVPLHVDACFGGFILPWLEQLGVVDLPAWDLRVPEVDSISADVHKYGYAAKGASVLLYRDMSRMRDQFFVRAGWVGGVYASTTMAGTRPGAPIAAAWAAMNSLGTAGYRALAAKAWEAAERLRAGVRTTEGLRLLGRPDATVVTWAAVEGGPDLYAIADALQDRGWGVDRQQDPPSVHCSLNACNLSVIDAYLADLRAAVGHARSHPEASSQGQAAIYGTMAKVPIDGLVAREVRVMMERLYAAEGGEPTLDGPPLPSAVVRVLDVVDRARRKLRQRRRGR